MQLGVMLQLESNRLQEKCCACQAGELLETQTSSGAGDFGELCLLINVGLFQ